MTSPRTVLVVEDDAVIRMWLEACLADEGWAVVLAADGETALQQLCGPATFDLVLMDVWLPNLNGLEVLRAWRSLRPPCPAIVMTAYDASFDPAHAHELGAAHVLIKPFRAVHLFEAMDQALGGTPAVR